MIDTPRQQPDASLRVNMAIDEELDAANAMQFERDIASDPVLHALHTRIGAASKAVRRAAPKENAPSELRARVSRLAEVSEARPSRSMRFANFPRALAASLAVIAVIGALAWALRAPGASEDPQLQALVSGFMRGQVSGQPFDVASSDRHTVKPWLASRVTLGAAVVDLAQAGYPLAGGRIDIVDRAPVPTLVYRRREHFISVSELPTGRGAEFWHGSSMVSTSSDGPIQSAPMLRYRTSTRQTSAHSSGLSARRSAGAPVQIRPLLNPDGDEFAVSLSLAN